MPDIRYAVAAVQMNLSFPFCKSRLACCTDRVGKSLTSGTRSSPICTGHFPIQYLLTIALIILTVSMCRITMIQEGTFQCARRHQWSSASKALSSSSYVVVQTCEPPYCVPQCMNWAQPTFRPPRRSDLRVPGQVSVNSIVDFYWCTRRSLHFQRCATSG